MYDQRDHREDDQQMDKEAADVEDEEAASPKHDKNEGK
jgi:hypothetical protein